MAKKKIVCPKCGSTNIVVDGANPNAGFSFTSLGVKHGAKLRQKLSGKKENAECLACKHVWEQK